MFSIFCLGHAIMLKSLYRYLNGWEEGVGMSFKFIYALIKELFCSVQPSLDFAYTLSLHVHGWLLPSNQREESMEKKIASL